MSLEGFGIPAESAGIAPAKIMKWLDALHAMPEFKPYANLGAVADRLQKNNPRLKRGQAEFLAVDTRRRPGRVRLTRRGRAVLLLLALALAGLAVVLAAPASQAADPAGPVPTVVTRSGDTLWSIATRYAPGGDPFATIDEIRRLNGISGYMVPVGVRLTLPRRR